MILTPANWTDSYRYDDRGNLLGWTRKRAAGGSEEFTADGRLVVSRDAKGEPAETRGVRYGRKQSGPDAMPELIQEPDPAAR
jgi:YD repeat-containing protein